MIRSHGAASIAQGRTSHEVHDEMCHLRAAWVAPERTRRPLPRSRPGVAADRAARSSSGRPSTRSEDLPYGNSISMSLRPDRSIPRMADEIDALRARRSRSTSGRPRRRGRLPGHAPEQRHLRPAPGRHQPDGAGEGPPTAGSPPSSSRSCANDRRDLRVAAGATSPPARTCSSTSCARAHVPEVLRLPGVRRA